MMKIARNYFEKLVMQNLGWKLVSLVIAVLVWFIVTNVENPVITNNYTIPVKILNKDKIAASNLVLLNQHELEGKRITVRVSAARSDIRELDKDKNYMYAYIDLTPVDISYLNNTNEPLQLTPEIRFPENLNPNRYEVSGNVSKVTVQFDYSVTVPEKITKEVKGEVAAGYVSMPPEIVPDTVQITGAQSIVSTIGTVEASVDITNATQDISAPSTLTVYNNNGENITDQVSLSESSVTVNVAVNHSATIPVKANLTGTLPAGYKLGQVTVSPSSVDVVGRPEDIAALPAIELSPISLDGLTQDTTKPFDIRGYLMDTNLTIRNGTPHEVSVAISVIKEGTRTLQIPLSQIHMVGLPADAEYNDSLTLVLKGDVKALDAIDPETVKGTADFTGLSPGSYGILVSFDLPEGVSQAGEPAAIEVIIPDPGVPTAGPAAATQATAEPAASAGKLP